jgi:hypothetical protein
MEAKLKFNTSWIWFFLILLSYPAIARADEWDEMALLFIFLPGALFLSLPVTYLISIPFSKRWNDISRGKWFFILIIPVAIITLAVVVLLMWIRIKMGWY